MRQEEMQTEKVNYDWVCQAIAATEETCKLSATCHCSVCGKWFCALHAEDEEAHTCAVLPVERGGEA